MVAPTCLRDSAADTELDTRCEDNNMSFALYMIGLALLVGGIAWGLVTAGLAAVYVGIACLIVGFRPSSVMAIVGGLVFMTLIAVMFTALGTAIASVLSDFQGFQMVMNFLVMPIFFLSGALFPLIGLPRALDIIAKIDPLSYGVDGLRSSITGLSHFGQTTDLAVLTVLTVALLLVGTRLFAKIQI